MLESFPTKVRTVHAMIRSKDEILRKVILPVIKFILGKHIRLRVFLHSGSDQCVLQRLRKFGIDTVQVESVLQSDLGMPSFRKWMEERRVHERRLLSEIQKAD